MTSVPALAIGAVAGGTRASRDWEIAVKRLGRRVIDVRGDAESPLRLNVVYQIPGELTNPDFEGVRSGRFSRKEARLLVQVALPPQPREDAYAEARALLDDAVALAEDFAFQEGLTDKPRLDAVRALLDQL